MAEECVICGAPLEYLNTEEQMECALCHKKELSGARCVEGHYVCNECHTKGVDTIIGTCLASSSKDPIEIIRTLMEQPFCHMHGPEHHIMVGAALLTAYHNACGGATASGTTAGGELDLRRALLDMMTRGKKVPGGTCGFWGACGAAISTGMFVSIISGATPLSAEPWGLANTMTARALERIGAVGGPRCCKRNSFLAIQTAVDFVREHFGVEMESPEVVCRFIPRNNQCIGKRCPYAPANHTQERPQGETSGIRG